MEVLGNTRSTSLDVEAQSRHEGQSLFHDNLGPPTPGAPVDDRRERTMSNESSAPSTPYEDRQMHYAVPPSSAPHQQEHLQQPPYQQQHSYDSRSGIPTINIQGTTPRGSMASGRAGSEFDAAYDDRWNYAEVPSTTTIDLHGVSPLDQTRMQARRQASDGSWKTASEEQSGYAM